MREPFSLAADNKTTATGTPCKSSTRCRPVLKAISLCAVLLLPSLYSLPNYAQVERVAAPAYSIESAAAVTSLLLDVVRAGQRLVAVGDRGHILYSDDNGQQWLQARVPTQQLLTAVYFVDERHGWAVGHDALILATRDGGATWSRQYDDLAEESPLLDVWFKDSQHGYAVGAYGMVLETRDGGQDWQRIDEELGNEDAFHLNAIQAVNDSGIFIVGEMGVMFRSKDWGTSWESLEGPYNGSLFGILAGSQPDQLLVYGLRGHIFKSTDFADSWQAIEVQTEGGPLQYGLAGGAVMDNGDLLIVGHGGTLLRSTDAGESFSVESRADRTSLAAVVDDQQGGLILVGQNGIHHTDANGNDLLNK